MRPKPTYADAFDKWNSFYNDGGWIISPKGANPITFEVIADSLLAATLQANGHQLAGAGSRIISNAIRENVASRYRRSYYQPCRRSADHPILNPATEGITMITWQSHERHVGGPGKL